MTLDSNTGLLILMGLDVLLVLVAAAGIIGTSRRAKRAFERRSAQFIADEEGEPYRYYPSDEIMGGEHTGNDRRPHDDLRSFTNPRR